MMEIGFKLSTLYKFAEYPGPDGARGAASGCAFVLLRQETKNTVPMIKSIIPVVVKLTQTAGFLKTLLESFSGWARSGTTIGDV